MMPHSPVTPHDWSLRGDLCLSWHWRWHLPVRSYCEERKRGLWCSRWPHLMLGTQTGLMELIALRCGTNIRPRMLSGNQWPCSHKGLFEQLNKKRKKIPPIFPHVMLTIRKTNPHLVPGDEATSCWFTTPDLQISKHTAQVFVWARGYFYPHEAGGVLRTHRVMECLQLWIAASHTDSRTDRQTCSHRSTLCRTSIHCSAFSIH